MNLFNLRFMKAIRNRDYLDRGDLIEWQAQIPLYVYPIGVFPREIISNNSQYLSRNFASNLEYIRTTLTFIYNEIYTEEEIGIISAYLTCYVTNETQLDAEKIPYVLPYISKTSDKPEIQYCIEEIKYYYLYMLLDVNTQSSNDTFNSIMAELKPIEARHNLFTWEEKNVSNQISFNETN